jgi:hypothetical protein
MIKMLISTIGRLTSASGLCAALVVAAVMMSAVPVANAQCDFDRIGKFGESRYQNVSDVVIDADRAYVFTPERGVVVYGISDINNPVELRRFVTPGVIRLWTLEDDVLWVLDENDLLRAYDTTTTLPLSLIGSFDMTGTDFETVYQFNSEGSKLFVDTPDGFAVYSVAQPALGPVLLGSIAVGNPVRAVAIDESRGYLFSYGAGGLHVFDVSDPSQIVLLAIRFEVIGNVFAYSSPILYTTTTQSEVRIRAWDLSNVFAPSDQIGMWVSPESSEGSTVSNFLLWDDKLYFQYSVGVWEYDSFQGEYYIDGVDRTKTIDLLTLTTLGDVPFINVRSSTGPTTWTGNQFRATPVSFEDMLNPQTGSRLHVAAGVSFADVSNGLIYGLDTYNNLVVIFDASYPDLEEPLFTALIEYEKITPDATIDYVRGLKANGGFLIVATEQRAIVDGQSQRLQVKQLYDLSDPTQAVFVRTLDWGFDWPPVPEFDGHLGWRNKNYVGDKVWLYDWSDPANPIETSVYTPASGNVMGATALLETGLLFVTTMDALEIVDISDLDQPEILSTFPGDFMVAFFLAASPEELVVEAFDGSLAFFTFDISNPLNPVHVASVPRTTASFDSVKIFDDLAIFSSGSGPNTRSIYDISDLSAPPLLKHWSDGAIDDFFVHNGILFAFGGSGITATLRSFDLQGSTTMAMLGSVGTAGSGFGVSTTGDLAVLSSYDSGVHLFDTSDPADPFLVGSYDTPDRAYQTVIVDGIAYIADGLTGLLILDVSDPSSPLFVSSLATSDLAIGLAVDGGFAYVATRFDGLQIIDVSIPSSPVLAASVDTPGSAQSVAVSGNTVYVADGSRGVQVVDITSRSTPAIVGSYDTPHSARQVYLQGVVAYVPDRTTGLVALDVSDRTNPQLLGIVGGMTDARSVSFWGHLGFVVDFDGRVHLVDATTPSEMQVVGSISTLGTGRSIVADGKVLYVADGDSGLTVLEARPCWYRPCPADLIEDGLLDFFDLQAYLNAYSASDGLADWNDDGQIDFFDLQRYLIDFADGCP